MNKPFIVIGAGGHAKVVTDLLLAAGETVIGLTDQNSSCHGDMVLGCPILGDDDILSDYKSDEINLAMGVGATGKDLPHSLRMRYNAFQSLKQIGFSFPPIVHPSAVLGREVEIEDGAQIMAGSVIQSGSRIGELAIINTNVSIDHDCEIGIATHLGPRAVLGGRVRVGMASYIGLGAIVLQTLVIKDNSVVGAGSVVVNDVKPSEKVMGIPARVRK